MSAPSEHTPGKIDDPREERIAMAVDEFYQFLEDELRYLAEWWEIDVRELIEGIAALCRRKKERNDAVTVKHIPI